MEGGEGGPGNAGDRFTITGTDWVKAETIAANSITVDGGATTHKLITVRSDLTFGPISVKITAAITTVGQKDIAMTGTTSNLQTFADYWEVSEGAGLTSVYRYGGGDKLEAQKSERLEAIDDGLAEYYTRIRSFLTLTDNVHTMGAYPKVTIRIVSYLAVALLWEAKGGNEEYLKQAKHYEDKADKLIQGIADRSVILRTPDGTDVGTEASTQYDQAARTGSFGVLDHHDEEVFDN